MDEIVKKNLDYIFDGVSSRIIDLIEQEGLEVTEELISRLMIIACDAKAQQGG